MIFELVQDLRDAIAAMPLKHPKRQVICLLDEAIKRDVSFIDRHPTTLFQCLRATCWWYDTEEAALHYEEPVGGWQGRAPWQTTGLKLSDLLDTWHAAKIDKGPFTWVRSLRPPALPLAAGLLASMATSSPSIGGRDGRVFTVAVSSDGAWCAAGLACGTVVLFDLETGRERFTMAVGESVAAVAFSPDSRMLAAGTLQGSVLSWSLPGTTDPIRFQQDTRVNGVAFRPQGRMLLASSGSVGDEDEFNSVCVYDLDARERVFVRKLARPAIAAAWSPDGKSVIAGGTDAIIRRWSFPDGVELGRCEGHQSFINTIACSPDGTLLASGSGDRRREDRTVRLWSMETGQEIRTLTGYNAPIQTVAFSPDGRLLAAGTLDATVRIWAVHSGAEVVQHVEPTAQPILSAAFVPDGSRLVTAGGEGPLRVWSATTASVPRRLRGQASSDSGAGAAFSADGRLLATGVEGPGVGLWSSDTGLPIGTLNVPKPPQRMLFSADSQFLLAACTTEATVWSAPFHADSARRLQHGSYIHAIAFSPDGAFLATASGDRYYTQHNLIVVWETRSGQEVSRLSGHLGQVLLMAFSPNGLQVIASSENETLRWDWREDTSPAARTRGYELQLDQPTVWRNSSTDPDALLSCDNGAILTWYPRLFAPSAIHPDGLRWVSYEGQSVRLLKLEGFDLLRLIPKEPAIRPSKRSRR